jgi:rhomboid protease GluP
MQDFVQRLCQATPRTWVTTTVVVVNVLVWLLTVLLGAHWLSPSPQALLLLGGNFLPLTLEQPWRLMSSTVLHAGVIHLAFNMWAMLNMGRIAERFYGNTQFAIIYLASGLFGSLASLFSSAAVAVSVGASGAIFGVAGALLAALFTKPHKLPKGLVASMRPSLVIFVGYSLFMGFTASMIDNAAHIGGLVAGFVLATVMAERFDWEEYRVHGPRRAVLATAGALLLAGLVWQLVPQPAGMLR